MDETSQNQTAPDGAKKTISLKIFGVGAGGLNLAEQVAKQALPGVPFIAVNTDLHALATSGAAEKIFLESESVRGLRAGADSSKASADKSREKLKAACEGADVVFILAGLGGNAGTNVAPVLARTAKEAGALVLGFVTLPFDCEGNRRATRARHGLDELKAAADGVICLPNQKTLKLVDENASIVETFRIANEFLAEAVSGLWRLMANKGLIEIHFSDLCAVLRDRHGESAFATADGMGPTRSRDAIDKLFAHPMLDGGKVLTECDAILVSLMGGPDLAMAEVNRVMEHINGKCGNAQVMMGAAVDEAYRERLVVTIVAIRHHDSTLRQPVLEESAGANAPRASIGLDEQLLDRTTNHKPHSRFVPPPPALPPEQIEQILSRQGMARPRKGSSKMRQGQLPLEIVSKGRFDKSEPTIHKGEDLDVPTYIRRGVALN